MEHAEAHERLADLALEPGKLRALRDGAAARAQASHPDVMLAELRDHVMGCERCSADVEGWLGTWSALGDARRGARTTSDSDDRRVLVPSDQLRARTLAAIHAIGRPAEHAEPRSARVTAASAARPWRFRPSFGSGAVRGLLAAAAVLTLVLAGTIAIQSRVDLQRAQSGQAELAATTAALDRILAAPGHQLVALHAADGSTGGTLAWSGKEFVVLTSTLSAPASGQEYRCWIQVNGTRTTLGSLAFTDRVASWYDSMTGWEWDFVPGAQFGISLVGGDGTSAAPVLMGQLQ